MPKNTGHGSRTAREAAAASRGTVPDGAFALRASSVGKFTEQRKTGGRLTSTAKQDR